LIQCFARQLPDGVDGNIVNMLDECVWNLGAGFVSYTVSKSGLWSLTRSMALALAPRIRVNGIGPGPALPSRRQTDEQFAAHAASMPLGRGTTPAEICDTLRFILAAPAMTGQMIALDGGEHLDGPAPRKPAHLPAAQPAGAGAAPTRSTGTRRIFVRDLMLEGAIGIHDHEQDTTQRLRINVDLTLADAGPLDEKIANTVSYDDIVAGVKAIVDAGHVKLVETLADRIGDFCIADHRVAAARVRVEKLDAIADTTSVGVAIERLNTRP
jgi:dihydroneopterin aldolase